MKAVGMFLLDLAYHTVVVIFGVLFTLLALALFALLLGMVGLFLGAV